jgi:surface polysaccharide O-acyltransferase-like enzyme
MEINEEDALGRVAKSSKWIELGADTTYLDLLRVIASLLVMLTHVAAGLKWEFKGDGFPEFLLLMNAFSRAGVPLFIMMTGILFLEQPEFHIKQRLIRIVVPLLVWTTIYLLLYRYVLVPLNMLPVYKRPANLKQSFLFMFFSNEGLVYHFWYLYLLIGIYLVMPFLQKITQHSSAKELRYGLMLWLIFTIGWQTFTSFSEFIPYVLPRLAMNIPIFSGHVGYLFLGYYLHRYGCNTTLYKSPWLWLIGYIFISFAMVARIYIQKEFWNEEMTNFRTSSFYNTGIYVMVQSVSLLLFVKFMYARYPLFSHKRFLGWIKSLAQLSFVAYLVHVLVLELVRYQTLGRFSLTVHQEMFLEWILVILLSYLTAFFLSKLPKRLRRILGNA